MQPKNQRPSSSTLIEDNGLIKIGRDGKSKRRAHLSLRNKRGTTQNKYVQGKPYYLAEQLANYTSTSNRHWRLKHQEKGMK